MEKQFAVGSRHRPRRLRLLPMMLTAVVLPSCADLASEALFLGPRARLVASRQHRSTPSDQRGLNGLHRRSSESGGEYIDVASEDSRSRLVQVWGVAGVIAYLSFGVFKVVPIVLDGLGAIQEMWQWGLLAVCLLFFAYVEGYKGFQLGFSPRVVSRAWVVSEENEELPSWHKILAPAFCIGYFHGTQKRVISSWAVTTVIFAVVIGVKQLENPYRAIIDAGVIVGLVWGILSMVVIFLTALKDEKPPEFDPALPEDTPYTRPPAFKN